MEKDNNIQLKSENMMVGEFSNNNFFDNGDMIKQMDPNFFEVYETIKKMDPKFFQVYDMIMRSFDDNNYLSRATELQPEETVDRRKL